MKMNTENTIKDLQPTTRVQEFVQRTELNSWKKHFLPFGTKTEFENATGIKRQTLNKVLKNGRGGRATVGVIRTFIETQNQRYAPKTSGSEDLLINQ